MKSESATTEQLTEVRVLSPAPVVTVGLDVLVLHCVIRITFATSITTRFIPLPIF